MGCQPTAATNRTFKLQYRVYRIRMMGNVFFFFLDLLLFLYVNFRFRLTLSHMKIVASQRQCAQDIRGECSLGLFTLFLY